MLLTLASLGDTTQIVVSIFCVLLAKVPRQVKVYNTIMDVFTDIFMANFANVNTALVYQIGL
jgi:hypothetical protein